jgi:hypothetical protein
MMTVKMNYADKEWSFEEFCKKAPEAVSYLLKQQPTLIEMRQSTECLAQTCGESVQKQGISNQSKSTAILSRHVSLQPSQGYRECKYRFNYKD